MGVSDNRISAERTRLAASRLSIEIELAERARELLEVLIAHEHTQTEISLLGRALDELVPHLEAMEAQSTAGSISVSDYSAAKLAELDLDIRYQRAERQLVQIEKEIEDQFGIAVSVAKPLLTRFLENRPTEAASITAEHWSAVRLQDLSVQAAYLALSRLFMLSLVVRWKRVIFSFASKTPMCKLILPRMKL